MNFSFLPAKIQQEIKSLVTEQIPISLARSSTSMDGEPGESYVLGYKDKLLVFSRALGEQDYIHVSGNFGQDVGFVKLRKEGLHTFLDTEILGKKYSLKFSSFDEKNLHPIVEAGQAVLSDSTPSSVADDSEPSPKINDDVNATGILPCDVGLATALMFVASVDDMVSQEEDRYIVNLFENNQKILQPALAYYKQHTLDELLIALSDLTQEQKLCFVANMVELGMSDGVLHRSEMKIIRQFSEYMDISDDEYTTIKQVLLIKNQLSVLA